MCPIEAAKGTRLVVVADVDADFMGACESSVDAFTVVELLADLGVVAAVCNPSL